MKSGDEVLVRELQELIVQEGLEPPQHEEGLEAVRNAGELLAILLRFEAESSDHAPPDAGR